MLVNHRKFYHNTFVSYRIKGAEFPNSQIIQIKNVSKTFKKNNVLTNISKTVYREYICL